ncbi:MAG TPA: phosphatidate cytidylyltransferase [Acidobacteriota bacterium]|nr:phosphatidate cytidylyltransferase [Acidobacteriota bacterium]
MTRVLTAIFGIPILIYLIKFAPASVFTAAVLLAMLVSLYEYFLLTSERGSHKVSLPAYGLASLVLLSFYFVHIQLQFFFPLGAALVLLVALFSGLEPLQALRAAALALLGVWYVGGLLGYLVGVRMIEAGGETGADLTLMLFVMIWSADTFAYVVGKTMGRHKLAAVSPNKTVEGAVAGFLFSIVAAFVCRAVFVSQLTVRDCVILGALTGVLGQVGDLCESLLKRSANAKDSGSVIPGHGGMLDRLDSLLFGAPAMYYYFYLVLHK